MNVAVFGAGYWGSNYIRDLLGMPEHKLVAVIEPDCACAERMVNPPYNCGDIVKPWLHSDIHVDAAIIATPPNIHADIALPLLQSGIRVLIEKPLACSVYESERLGRYADKIMVGHTYMFHPMMAELREYSSHVKLSHAFSRRTNAGPIRSWQDAVWDLAPHDISIFNALFGKCLGVERLHVCNRDWGIIGLQYEDVCAAVYVSWLGGPKSRIVELVPSENGSRYIFEEYKNAGFPTLESPLELMLAAFLNNQYDGCTYEDGVDVVSILEKVSM